MEGLLDPRKHSTAQHSSLYYPNHVHQSDKRAVDTPHTKNLLTDKSIDHGLDHVPILGLVEADRPHHAGDNLLVFRGLCVVLFDVLLLDQFSDFD